MNTLSETRHRLLKRAILKLPLAEKQKRLILSLSTQSLAKQPIKGTQRNDQVHSQVQLNELAERLKFIEQKLLENELNTEKKLQTMTMPSSYHQSSCNPNGYPGQYVNQPYTSGYIQNASSNHSYSYISQPVNGHQNGQNFSNLQNGQKTSYPIGSTPNNCQTIGPNFLSNNSKNSSSRSSSGVNSTGANSTSVNSTISSQNQDDLCLKNGQFRTRIYPSISFGDCSEIHILQPKKSQKRHFFSSAIKNSKSLGGYFNWFCGLQRAWQFFLDLCLILFVIIQIAFLTPSNTLVFLFEHLPNILVSLSNTFRTFWSSCGKFQKLSHYFQRKVSEARFLLKTTRIV